MVGRADGRSELTLLFVDIVGSTETVQRIGDREWARLHTRHKYAVEGAVDHNDGWLASFAGDGFLAAFEDPGAALRGAAGVRAALAALGLQIRTGIHHGEVDVSDGDVTGLNVHVAARVMGSAGAGQIVLTAEARRRLPAGAAVWSELGWHGLRGLNGTWQLWLAEPSEAPSGPPSRPAPLPLPPEALPLPPAAGTDEVQLVGREEQIRRLGQVWQEVLTVGARAVAIGAEPGAGKTRLVIEQVRRFHADGATVLWGRCDEGLAVPFQPFVEQVGFLVDSLRRVALRELLGRDAAELARLVPRIGAVLPGLQPAPPSDPGTERFRLFEATVAALSRLSQRAPLVLVVDDLHWATPSTWRLLRFLIERAGACRILLLLTYRNTAPDFAESMESWMADAGRRPGFSRLALPGLSPDALGTLIGEVAASLPLSADEQRDLADAIHARTSGNPLFSIHVARELSERFRATGRVDDPARLVQEEAVGMISARLGRLPPDTKALLMDAAVLGRRFEVGVLARMAALDVAAAVDGLDAAVDAHLVRPDPSGDLYEFAHALVVDAILARWRPARLRRAHRRAAAVLEEAAPTREVLAELTRHYGAARTDPDRELAHALAAGRASMQALAYADAAGYLAHALDAAERVGAGTRVDPVEVTAIRLELAVAEAAAGLPSHRATLERVWAEATGHEDPDLLARAALAVARGNWSMTGEVDEKRVAVLDAALRLRPDDDPVRVQLIAQLATELNWAGSERPRREALAAEALALADGLDDPGERLNVIGQCAAAVQHPDNVAWMAAILDRHEAELDLIADPVIALQSWWTWAALAGIEGDAIKARRRRARIEAITEGALPPLVQYLAQWIDLGFLFIDGRFDEVLDGAACLVDLGAQLGLDEGSTIHAFYHLLVAHLRGESADLLPLLEDYTDQYSHGMPGLQAALAMVYAENGRLADALAVLDRIEAGDYHSLRQDQSTTLWLVFAADAARRTGATVHADRLMRLLEPYCGQLAFNGGMAIGSVSHWVGILAASLGDEDGALAHLAAAESLERSFGMDHWAEASRAHAAIVRAGRGEVAAAAELRAIRAEAVARRQGLLVEDIDVALRSHDRTWAD